MYLTLEKITERPEEGVLKKPQAEARDFYIRGLRMM